MKNLVISPSQQTGIEENLVRPHAELLYKKIKADGLVNVALVPDYVGMSDNQALAKVIQFSNDFIRANGGNGYHLELHADAGRYARGASGLYVSEAGKNFIAPVVNNIMAATPWNDVGLRRRTDLGALNQTIAVAGLLEESFYDDSEELAWMQNNPELITDLIKDGLYKGMGIEVPMLKELTFEEAIDIVVSKTGMDKDYWMKVSAVVKYFPDLITKIGKVMKG